MKQKNTILDLSKNLYCHFNENHRKLFWWLLVLMIITSIAEIFSIGSIIPFLALLTNPQHIYDYEICKKLLNLFGFYEIESLFLPLTLIFGVASLIAGSMRLLLLWSGTKLAFAAGADLSTRLYKQILYQPYSVHISRNSSEVIDGISKKINTCVYSLNYLINFISSIVFLVIILLTLLMINPIVTVSCLGGMSSIYLGILLLTRKQMLLNSAIAAQESTAVIKTLQEGLGGIRDILIDGSQQTFFDIYHRADKLLRKAEGSNTFIINAPRFAVEALGMMLIAFFVYFNSKNANQLNTAIPFLGAFALGAQRLLPIFHQAYSAWSNLRSTRVSLSITLKELDEPYLIYNDDKINNEIKFEKSIILSNISFRYNSTSPYILKDISFTIPKGSRIGFIGKTGSGKSTLLDILMGLLSPTGGILKVDGNEINEKNQRAWQKHISHVPQFIYLADKSIEENVAFGVPVDEIDFNLVQHCCKIAQMSEIIENMSLKYKTIIGERGVRLSGGQRQRIGIARALYKKVDVLVLDEATNALDTITEKELLDALQLLEQNITILVITHRISTLNNCNYIFEVENKNLKDVTKSLNLN